MRAIFVQKTIEGNYIIVGKTDSMGSGAEDVFLVKMQIDFSGSGTREIWSKTYGTKDVDFGYSIRQTSDLGYIIAGNTGTIVDKKYSFDFNIIKTDADGNQLWSKTFGSRGNVIAYEVIETPDGGYMLAGITYSQGAGKSDLYLIKTESAGKKIWSKMYGGKGYDGAYSIRETSDQGIIIAGYIWSGEEMSTDMYIIKIENPAKIKVKQEKYSYEDFLEAGKNRNLARLMEYAGKSADFTFFDRSRPDEGEIDREGIANLFMGLFEKEKITWKFYDEKGNKHVACWDDYPITYRFYFEEKSERLILVKIEQYFPGL